MNPQTVLQERYPAADFSLYFCYLEACRLSKQETEHTHGHHICPKEQFPEYKHDPDNQITLTVAQHSHAHELLYAAVPELGAVAAWIESQAEVDHVACGRIGGHKSRELHKGIHALTFEQRSVIGVINGNHAKEQRFGVCGRSSEQMSEDGRKGGLAAKENGVGWFAPGVAANAGHLGGLVGGRKGSQITNHKRWHAKRGIVNPKCELCCAK